MKSQEETARSATAAPTVLTIGSALAASAFLVGLLVAGLHFGSGGIFWPLRASGDSVSQDRVELRAQQFAVSTPLALSPVSAKDQAVALDSMHLSPADRTLLAEGLPEATPAASPVAATDAQPDATPAPAAVATRVRLAWITLWDTDAEDGDVVRLDSGGYSRTITLAKSPVTFAVPVPRDGIVHVTGVRDGEGGGITVGMASGASQAILPIMSTGQTLGLRVSGSP